MNEARGRSVRPAGPDDVPAILGLVHELAVYEKAPDAVKATEAHFREALFPQDHAPTAFAHVAVVNGTVVGMAIWYICLLYTSDAADDLLCVDLGGRRIIKK